MRFVWCLRLVVDLVLLVGLVIWLVYLVCFGVAWSLRVGFCFPGVLVIVWVVGGWLGG